MLKNISKKFYSYTINYEEISECGYQVTVPLLPGLITYGRNFEEAKKMAKDAIKCHFEAMQKDKEKMPNEISLLQEKLTISLPV
ncbi:type II toxin-antitoxin system HicB family antitoxin [Candidatus Parcubacteria bacterium]|nr:type II toxin-antitoxin system HicB family antitoxin [Candidatus Parcubacteria bacterium]